MHVMSLQTVKLQAHLCFTVFWHMLRDRMTTSVPTHDSQFGLFDRSFAVFMSTVLCNNFNVLHMLMATY